MLTNGLVELLKERLEKYPKDEKMKDFINCILEIDEKPEINNHKHTHAIIESLEEDEYYNPCVIVRIYLKS